MPSGASPPKKLRAETAPAAPLSPNVADLAREASAKFSEIFKAAPSLVCFAPGRVNLGGEHTDYSQGYVLPIAIELGVVCVARTTPSLTPGVVRAFSLQKASENVVEFNVGGSMPQEPWAVFLAGVAAMHAQRAYKDGHLPFGVECVFASDVPLGGGLSSSAALDVVFCLALEQFTDANKPWSGVERALTCVEADHAYPKVPCGIMDQFISSNGVHGSALLIDCRTSTFELVPFDDESICIVVANTNVAHTHSTGEYSQRVAQCKAACAALGVPFLRDVRDPADVDAIQDVTVRKRARHVVGEIARCLQIAQAARARNWKRFGELMARSHDSLRDDFQVSCPELDVLVEIAQKHPGVFGARMTGGGFGGCVVALVEKASAQALVSALEKQYSTRFAGKHCTCHVFNGASSGCRVLDAMP